MAIRESLLNTISTIATSDFVRAVTSAGASSKVTVSNLAKAIIENYTGSSLAGSSQSLKNAIDSQGVITLSASTVSSLPHTISDANITANHVVVWAVLSNPYSQVSDWTVTTSAGSAVISGTINGGTNITLYLAPTKA